MLREEEKTALLTSRPYRAANPEQARVVHNRKGYLQTMIERTIAVELIRSWTPQE